MTLANLTSSEQQLQRCSLSPDQSGSDPHSAVGEYNSPYFYLSAVTLDILGCLSLDNPVEKFYRFTHGSRLIEQVTEHIYQ